MSLRLVAALTPGALATVLTAAGSFLFSLAPRASVPIGLHVEETYPYILMTVSLGIVGAAIALRHPSNPIGWLLSAAALGVSLEHAAGGYATYGLLGEGGLPYADVVAWSFAWGGILPALFQLPLLFLFPDGRLRSRRDSVGLITGMAALVLLAGALALRPGPLYGLHFVQNPYGWREGEGFLDLVLAVAAVLAIGAIVMAARSLRARSRGAAYLERQQLKWLYGGVGLYLAINALIMPVLLGEALGIPIEPTVRYAARLVAGLSLTIFPIAIGIAILRYRLYAIDVVIRRTLVYGGVSAILAVTYFAAVVVLQALLRPFTSGSELAVAGSTLLVVALFQPVRGRAHDAVDRRFYRSRYDAVRTLDAFTARLRSDVDIDSVRQDVLGVVRDTMRPSHASVWLRRPR